MFTHMHVEWLVIPVAIMLAIGVIAQLSTWVVGPAKSLLPAAMTGDLPPIFRKTNKYGMPLGVLVVQGIISSAFAIAMIAIPSINEGYWILTAITSLINAVMYMFMFAAFIKLRKTKPDVKRPYKRQGRYVACGWCCADYAVLRVCGRTAAGDERCKLWYDADDSVCDRYADCSAGYHSSAAGHSAEAEEAVLETERRGGQGMACRGSGVFLFFLGDVFYD